MELFGSQFSQGQSQLSQAQPLTVVRGLTQTSKKEQSNNNENQPSTSSVARTTATSDSNQAGSSRLQQAFGIDFRLLPKTYMSLTEKDCIEIVSESLKSILMNTFNDDFRKECFDLLQANSSEQAARRFQNIFETLCGISNEEDLNSASNASSYHPTLHPFRIPTNNNTQEAWAIPPSPTSGSQNEFFTLSQAIRMPPISDGIENNSSERLDYTDADAFIDSILSTPKTPACKQYSMLQINEDKLPTETTSVPITSDNENKELESENNENQNSGYDTPDTPGSPSLLQDMEEINSSDFFSRGEFGIQNFGNAWHHQQQEESLEKNIIVSENASFWDQLEITLRPHSHYQIQLLDRPQDITSQSHNTEKENKAASDASLQAISQNHSSSSTSVSQGLLQDSQNIQTSQLSTLNKRRNKGSSSSQTRLTREGLLQAFQNSM